MERDDFKKPNASLTAEEREAKKNLKKKLKLQAKINRLEKQIRHSISRKDPVVEKEARKNLRELLAQNGLSETDSTEDADALKNQTLGECSKILLDGSSSLSYETSPDMTAARELVLSIRNSLFANDDCDQEQKEEPYQKSESGNEESPEPFDDSLQQLEHAGQKRKSPSGGPNIKAEQTKQAVKLLKHMTKGTQSGSMFSNHRALWGYTRQKFKERALLLYRSLRQLGPDAPPPDGCEGMTTDQARTRKEVWAELARVKKACSIGAGPGNDAVGLLAFLHVNGTESGLAQPLPTMSLLDCFIDDWRPILSHLQRVLDGKDIFDTKLLTGFCDVTKPFDLSKMTPSQSLGPMCTGEKNRRNGAAREDSNSVSAATGNLPYDMFLFSYLLSETRGKWDSFILGLLQAAKPGSMFYFAEPVPWMLHHLMNIGGDILDFLWLDSSMHYPSMQALDGRVGPAVLFARKKRAPLSS